MSVSKSDAIVVPSLDIDKGFKQTNVTTIGILPTADVPASTNIQWSGYARAALFTARVKESYTYLNQPAGTTLYSRPFSAKNTSIAARGQLKVVGTTDTAVGEVGAQIQLRGNWNTVLGGDPAVIMNEAWGWWKMTPELTLGGGYTGSLSNIGYGYDGACNCYYTDNAPVALNPGDTAQMRLSYASGPMSFAIALEDGVASDQFGFNIRTDLGVAGELKYSGDSYSGEISGGYWNHGSGRKSEYQLGVGAGFNIGDMAKLSLAAGLGRTPFGNFSRFDRGQAKFWKASALASANLSDSVHAEIAYGYAHWTGLQNSAFAPSISTKANTHAVLAGIYYDPVSQLTIGLEGEWFRTRFSGSNGVAPAYSYSSKITTSSVDLVTVFRF
jgi:opacity protein-like surface antigen